jgi:two-component SAPR family response regulator
MRIFILGENASGVETVVSRLYKNGSSSCIDVMDDQRIFMERVRSERPEMVFIQMGSRDVSGLEISRSIREIDTNIKVVFVDKQRDYTSGKNEVMPCDCIIGTTKKTKFHKYIKTI